VASQAAAKPFGAIDQMIVLNGAQGLSEALAQALSQGIAGLQMARQLLSGGEARVSEADGKGPRRELIPEAGAGTSR